MRDYTNVQAVLNTIYLASEYGAPMKCGDDVLRYKSILATVEPEVVVETGFGLGHSARWFATWAPQVITIESNVERLETVGEMPASVMIYAADSLDAEMFAVLTKEIGDRTVLVSLDSDHHGDHVAAELERYSTLVTPGSYIVVEDTFRNFADDPDDEGNAYWACQQFLENHRGSFELDTTLQDLTSFTLNPNGWIRRTN